MRSWDQRGWPCWTPPPPPRSCPISQLPHSSQNQPLFPLATHFRFCIVNLVDFYNKIPHSSFCSLKPNHALMNKEGWLWLAGRSDGFTFWQSFQRTAPACQSAETTAGVYKSARPAATHSDLSHCFDIFVGWFAGWFLHRAKGIVVCSFVW